MAGSRVEAPLAPSYEVLDVAHNAFVSLDPGGHIVYWNRRAEDVFGYSRGEALGAEFAELVIPERYRQRHRDALRRFADEHHSEPFTRQMHLSATRRGGAEFPIDLSIVVPRTGNGALLHAWIQDVSERAELLQEIEAQLRRGGPGMAEILDSLAEAVTIRDPYHHIIYANRAAIEHMGFASLEELQRMPPNAIMGDYIVQDEHGEPLTMEDIPSVRLLSGDQAESLVMRTVHRTTGEVRWQVLKASVLRDEAGDAVAAVTVIEDVTREKLAEQRDRFLARATETLMSSLDYQETLRNVAWLVVPEIADWCAVDLVDDAGRRQQVVVAHPDPAKLELAKKLRAYEPPDLDADRGVGRVLRTGVAELYRDISDEMLVATAVDEEHLALLRAVGFRSAIIAPLQARDRTFGVMTLVTAESMRRFDASDQTFAERLAVRAAIAVDNAKLATSRREIAETLQRSLLPDAVPKIPGWEVATLYRAASAMEEVEVGGDFYDFFDTAAGWIVLLGDVTGRGVAAASMTALVRHGARFLSRHERNPSRILKGLDEALRERARLSLCSAVCIRLAHDGVWLSSAGHPPPLVVRAQDGRIRELGVQGPLLGAWTGSPWVDQFVPVMPDETLVMYTDGVTDTPGPSDRFGGRRLRRLMAEHAGATPAELLSALQDALERFQVKGTADDTAVVALRPTIGSIG